MRLRQTRCAVQNLVVHARQQDECGTKTAQCQMAHQHQPIHAGHGQVADDHGNVRPMPLKLFQRLGAAGHQNHLAVAQVGKLHADQLQLKLVVINHQNHVACHRCFLNSNWPLQSPQ